MNIELGDDDLRAAFADYRVSESPRVRAAGVGAAQRGGLARRRRRYGFLSAMAIVGLLAPAAAFALNSGGGTPIGGESPMPQRTGAEIPKGGLTRAQLMASSVDMPVFEGDTTGACPHGEVGFADDRLVLYTWPDTGDYMAYADIDGNGSFETVLHVRCLVAQKVVAEQILVVARGEGAGVKLLGRVLGTGGDVSAVGNVSIGRDRWQVNLEAPGVQNAIYLTAAGPRTCCEAFYTAVEHQRRAYVWDGQGFKLRAGSTSFGGRAPADLVVTVKELIILSNDGNFQLTITNAGTRAVDNMELTLVTQGLRPTDPEWMTRAPGTDPATVEYMRPLVGLRPGESRTIDVPVRRVITSSHSGSVTATVVGTLGDGEIFDEAADANPGDNEDVEVVIRSE